MTAAYRVTRLARSALTLAAFVACADESLSPPTSPAGTMFARYVAIGNSITAGYESGGINDSTQRASYAVLLAKQFGLRIGKDFTIPSFALPGCPPPIVNIFVNSRLDTIPQGCAFREPVPPAFISNVAVPGAAVLDAFSNVDPASRANPLTTMILGGRTQLQAARLVRPTFVTVWIGNNDVLGSLLDTANAGNPALITSSVAFRTRYRAMLDSLESIGTIQGGVLIGVVQVVSAPYASTGTQYWNAAQTVDSLVVLDNCKSKAPIAGRPDSAEVLVPFHYGAPIFAAAVAGTPDTLDCSVPQVVAAAETSFMITMVTSYNQTIAEEATARGYAFFDPNPLLQQLLADPAKIRPFPAFDPADPQHTVAPFGTALSRDGFHPSASSQILIMQGLLEIIDDTYGTNLAGS